MMKHRPPNCFRQGKIVAIVISAVLPMLLASRGAAQCQPSEIQAKIETMRGRAPVDATTRNFFAACGSSAIPILIDALQESDIWIHNGASFLLQDNPQAVPNLKQALQHPNPRIASGAARILGQVDSTTIISLIPDLLALLDNPDFIVRGNAARALGSVGAEDPANIVPALTALLQDGKPAVRNDAAIALAEMPAADVEIAIPELIDLLEDNDATVRANTAGVLSEIQSEATRTALPGLVELLEDREESVRSAATLAVSKIAKRLQAHADKLSGIDLEAIAQLEADRVLLEKALIVVSKSAGRFDTAVVTEIRLAHTSIRDRISILRQSLFSQALSWMKNPLILVPAAYLLLYLSIFALRPLWLLKVDDWLQPVSVKLRGLEISPRVLLLLRYHPRVLDAWVARHLPAARKTFVARKTVQDRAIHLPVPVELNRSTIADLRGADLRSSFRQPSCLLLICGEGGAGKTSLACQIARWAASDDAEQRLCDHRLLPVLIEIDLSDAKPLSEAIREQLLPSAGGQPISDALLKALLRQRRLLLIIDHFSEMGTSSRQHIQTDLLHWPANALILTSRLEDELPNRSKILLQPQRIEGGRLFDFFSAYLRQQDCRDAFVDGDLFQACYHLAGMNLERQITVLLAKLYIEQLIDAQLGRVGAVPDTIPDLMRSYLNRLNASVDAACQQPNLTVQRWARAVAWACLEPTYRPAVARRDPALALLKTENPTDLAPEDCLVYLEQRLRVVQTLEPGDKLRLTLDPLAEYLAGLYLVDRCGDAANSESETLWRDFLESVENKKADPATLRGFLLAVRDCCQSQQSPVPDFVPDALAALAGLDPAELARIHQQQRIRRLSDTLMLPDATDRAYAVAELSKVSGEARAAVPALTRLLHKRDEDLTIRQQVLEILVAAGWEIEGCVDILENSEESLSLRCLAGRLLIRHAANLSRPAPDFMVEQRDGQPSLRAAIPALTRLLHKRDEDLTIRQQVLEILMAAGWEIEGCVDILENNGESLSLRYLAGRFLRQHAANLSRPVPDLIVEQRDGQPSLRLEIIPGDVEDLGQGVRVELVSIPGGNFVMGSPKDEPERRESEAPQHPVMVPAFSMGKYPVTQAQWKVVAARPQIDRQLDLDPSSFKGDNRPVEFVSWDDVVEFCARLEKYTGRPYRLPSEAEWEYACRAGTTTPFHFGEMITPEVANYASSVAFEDGPTGEWQQETTPVDSFPANAFGLYDMHGNVWEWCADHWHSN